MIRVLIVETDCKVCQSVTRLLAAHRDFSVDCVERPEAAIERLAATAYDVVLVGARTVSFQHVARLRQAAGREGAPRVIVLEAPDSEEAILNYIQAGAAGYIPAGAQPTEILQRVRAAAEGKALLCPNVAAALMARIAHLAQSQCGRVAHPSWSRSSDKELTAREREIVELLSHGLSNRDIATKLVVEIGTVKNHVHSILRKLGASNRYEVVMHYPAWK